METQNNTTAILAFNAFLDAARAANVDLSKPFKDGCTLARNFVSFLSPNVECNGVIQSDFFDLYCEAVRKGILNETVSIKASALNSFKQAFRLSGAIRALDIQKQGIGELVLIYKGEKTLKNDAIFDVETPKIDKSNKKRFDISTLNKAIDDLPDSDEISTAVLNFLHETAESGQINDESDSAYNVIDAINALRIKITSIRGFHKDESAQNYVRLLDKIALLFNNFLKSELDLSDIITLLIIKPDLTCPCKIVDNTILRLLDKTKNPINYIAAKTANDILECELKEFSDYIAKFKTTREIQNERKASECLEFMRNYSHNLSNRIELGYSDLETPIDIDASETLGTEKDASAPLIVETDKPKNKRTVKSDKVDKDLIAYVSDGLGESNY